MVSRIYIYAALAAAVLVAGGWWHMSRVKAAEKAVHAHYAVVLADIKDKTARAAEAIRAQEQAWQTSIDKVTKDGQDKIDTARRDAADANRAADGLRAAVNRYRAAARAATDTGAAGAGPTTDDALGVFADMLQELDRRAGVYAQAADAAHAAGVTCERAYGALSQP